MKRYSWLLFDLDHTLFDFNSGKMLALEQLFNELCGELTERMITAYHRQNNQCWQLVEAGELAVADVNLRRVTRTLKALDIKADYRAVADRFIALLAARPVLFDGAKQLIENLRSHYHLAAITNGFAAVKRPHLAITTLESDFSHTFISSEMGVSKPNSQYFSIVLAALQAPAESCLIIGDNLRSDILGGLNSGIDTCWYNPAGDVDTGIVPTYQVADYAALYALLMKDCRRG